MTEFRCPSNPTKAQSWQATWLERYASRWVPTKGKRDFVELAEVRDIRDALPLGRPVRPSDLAAQVDLELERQRGWETGDDGYYGPPPIPARTGNAELRSVTS